MKKIYLTFAALLTVTGLQAETTSASSTITKDGVTYSLNQYDNSSSVNPNFSRDLLTFEMNTGSGTLVEKYNTSSKRTDTYYCNATPTAVADNKINVDLSDFSHTEEGEVEVSGDLKTPETYAFGSKGYNGLREAISKSHLNIDYPFFTTWSVATQDEAALKAQHNTKCEVEWAWYDYEEPKASRRMKYFDSFDEMDENYSASIVAYWRNIDTVTVQNDTSYYVTYYAIEFISHAEQTITTVTNDYECQVTHIKKNGAFENKTNLQSVTISSNVYDIDPGAFQGCSNLNSFTTTDGGYYVCENGILYNEEKTSIIAATSNVASQEIPQTVATIENYAFYNVASPVTLVSRNDQITVGSNQGINFTLLNPSANLSYSATADGGYVITGNVVQSNLDALTLPNSFHYLDFTSANILENITVSNNSNAIYYFATNKTVTGENVVNNGVCAKLHIYDTKETFYIPTAFTADSAVYDRQFSTNWATLCLPFNVNVSDNLDMFCGELTNFNYAQFTFTYTTAIQANTPYIVRSKTDEQYIIKAKNTTVPATPASCAVTRGAAQFIGVYTPTVVTSADEDAESGTFYYGIKDCKFVKIMGATVNPFRAYLTIPMAYAYAPAVRLVDAMDQEMEIIELENTTGIEELNAKEVEDVVYDINGQRKAAATRGLNIVNGKAKIIK
jgi:hypothetical protein